MSFLDNIKIVGSKLDEFEQAKKEHQASLQRLKEERDEKMAAMAAKRKFVKPTTSVIVKEDRKHRWESARASTDSSSVRTSSMRTEGRTTSRKSAGVSQHKFEVTITSKNASYMTNTTPGLHQGVPPTSASSKAKMSIRPKSLQGFPRRDDGEETPEEKRRQGKVSSKSSTSDNSPEKEVGGEISSTSDNRQQNSQIVTDGSEVKKQSKPNYTTFLVSTGKAVFPQKSADSVSGNDAVSGSGVKSNDHSNAQNGSNENASGRKQDTTSGTEGGQSTQNGEDGSDVDTGSRGAGPNGGRDTGTANVNGETRDSEISNSEDIPNKSEAAQNEHEATQNGNASNAGPKSVQETGSLMPGNIEGDRPLSHPEEVTKYLRSVYVVVDKPEVLHSFQVGDEFVDTISCLSVENAWMFCDGNKFILVNKDGDKQRSIQLRGKIGDFCTLPSGEVLLTHMDDCCVYSIQANGVMTLKFKIEGLFPVAIQPTVTGNLLVTLADVWDYKIGPESHRLLRMYTMDGTILKTLEHGLQDERLFCKPGRVRVCKNNSNIGVCNFVNESPGNDHIVFVDKDFNFQFRSSERYTVPTDLQPQSHVVFDDMVFDSGDNIVTVETCSNSVQLLDKDCRYIKTLYKDPEDYEQPMSVALDTNGNLWIGFQKGHVKILKYRTQVMEKQEDIDQGQ